VGSGYVHIYQITRRHIAENKSIIFPLILPSSFRDNSSFLTQCKQYILLHNKSKNVQISHAVVLHNINQLFKSNTIFFKYYYYY
jgi:hypothetical protein